MTLTRLLRHTLWAALTAAVMLPASPHSLRLGGLQETFAADQLIGRAMLPVASFAPGPTSGTLLGDQPINGQEVPFDNK